MPAEKREQAIKRASARLERQKSKQGLDVSPEIYTVAEFGYYFGWDGVIAIKRGYIETVGSDGKVVKEPFTLEEAMVLLEGARKVWYSKLIEQTHSGLVANSFKTSSKSFDNSIKPFTDKAIIKG